MKSRIIAALILVIIPAASACAGTIPVPPDVSTLYSMIERPANNCNAAEMFLNAEKMVRKSDDEIVEGRLKQNSDAYRLVMKGLECRRCEFPFSLDMKLPPYEQMIPMMKLYRSAAKTFSQNGEKALEKKKFEEAEMWFSNALNLGLLLWEEPGITIIQDMISLSCLTEGAEGMGDLFIAKGDEDNAAACARFLAQKNAYLDALPRFVNQKLRNKDEWPRKASEEFKQIALLYPTVRYLPLKLEILLAVAELNAFTLDRETSELCRRVIDEGKKDPDARIRKTAEWAEELKKANGIEMIKELDGELPDDIAEDRMN